MLRQLPALLRVETFPVLGRLPAYSRLARALLREPALSRAYKVLLVGGVIYLLSPIDLIPGIIPVLGQLDDLAVALWVLRVVLRGAPPDVANRHLREQGLSWAVLDADLARVGRSGRLIIRAGLWAGGRALAGAGRAGQALLCMAQTLLARRRLRAS
jgi:uncharacterized membrane protein YkvA (DUF1232 family)